MRTAACVNWHGRENVERLAAAILAVSSEKRQILLPSGGEFAAAIFAVSSLSFFLLQNESSPRIRYSRPRIFQRGGNLYASGIRAGRRGACQAL